jgi:hypothetical protein
MRSCEAPVLAVIPDAAISALTRVFDALWRRARPGMTVQAASAFGFTSAL